MVMEPILKKKYFRMEMLKDVSKILTISVELLISEPTPKKSRPNATKHPFMQVI